MASTRFCWIAPVAAGSLLSIGVLCLPTRKSDSLSSVPRAATENLARCDPNPRRPEAIQSAPASGLEQAQTIPAWAIPFGKEFWRGTAVTASIKTGKGARSHRGLLPPERLAEAMERTSHAFRRDPSGTLASGERGQYRALLESEGLQFEAARPQSNGEGSTTPPVCNVHLYTEEIRCGKAVHVAAVPRGSDWIVVGDTAQFLLDPSSGLVEHYQAGETGLELTWLIRERPSAKDDLTFEMGLSGVQFAEESPAGLHFADASGVARVKLGLVFARDASGQTWRLAAEPRAGGVSVVVPATVLGQAEYPLAIDPLISAEFGVDQPIDGPALCTRAAPVIAANDSGYLVVWTHGKGDGTDPGVYGARLDPTGKLLDPHGILISILAGEQTVCAAAAPSNVFLVTWSAPRTTPATDWDILGARILADGTVLDSPPLPICVLSTSIQSSPAVAANGRNFLAAWRDGRGTGIYGTIINPDGRILFTNGMPISTALNDQYTPAVGALGDNYLVAWQDYRKASQSSYYSDIFAARVTGDGVLQDTNGIPVCTRTNSQDHPAVAANGTNYLVVWEDYDIAGNDIAGARVSPAGVVLDTNAIVVAHGPNAQVNPEVGAGEGEFFVVWQDFGGSPTNRFAARVAGVRVHGDGSVSDSGDDDLTAPASALGVPKIAARGDEFLVVWQDSRNNPDTTLADIYATRISGTSGVPSDFKVSGAVNAEFSPAVAALGSNYLAVWADTRNGATTGRDIYGIRLDQNGTVLDTDALPICTATNQQSDPDVAANGSNYLVVWSDLRNTPANASYGDIFGTLVSPAGTVQTPNGFPICTAAYDQSLASVAAQGTNFLVVWQDARSSTASTARWDIYGARLGAAGEVLDPNGFPICTNLAAQTNPVVAASPSQALVTWTDYRISGTAGHIYGARVDADGTVLDTNGLPICTASIQQSTASAAASGKGYFVAWSDIRRSAASVPDIYGAWVTPDGQMTPSNGFPVRIGATAQSAPDVTFNGLDYLVTWQEARDSLAGSFAVFGTLIDPEGALPSGAPLAIDPQMNTQLSPAATAAQDGRFLILQQSPRDSAQRVLGTVDDLEGFARLDASAVLLNGQFQFRLRGAAAARYRIETSDDLRTWTPLDTVTNLEHVMVFTDPAVGLARRFYRAVLLP